MSVSAAKARLLDEPWTAWTALAIGVLAITAQSASSMVFSVLMKPIVAEFGWDRTDFTTAMTLRMAIMVLVVSYAGVLTDRIGPRPVLAAGALIIGLGNLAMSRIESLGEFRLVMAWFGPGQAAIGTVAASALVLRRFSHRRSLAVGILNGGDNLVNSGVYYAAALLLAASGWRWTVVNLGSGYLILAVLILWALRTPANDAPAAARGDTRLRDVPWRDPRLWMVCGAYAMIYAFITSVQLHLHAYLTDLGHSPISAASVLSTLTLVGAIGAPFFGWLAERYSARRTLLIVVAGLALTSVVLWGSHSLPVFTAWAVVYGIVNSGVVALLVLVLHELFGAAQIGRLMGIAMVFCMSATMAANNFSAAMYDWTGSYRIAWQTYTGLMVLTLLPVEILRRASASRADRALPVSAD